MTSPSTDYPPSLESTISLQSHWTKIESSKSPNYQEDSSNNDEEGSEFSFRSDESSLFNRENGGSEERGEVKNEEYVEFKIECSEFQKNALRAIHEQEIYELKNKVNFFRLNFETVSGQLAAERNQSRSVIHYLQKIIKDLEEEKEMSSVADLREGNLKVDLFSDEFWSF